MAHFFKTHVHWSHHDTWTSTDGYWKRRAFDAIFEGDWEHHGDRQVHETSEAMARWRIQSFHQPGMGHRRKTLATDQTKRCREVNLKTI